MSQKYSNIEEFKTYIKTRHFTLDDVKFLLSKYKRSKNPQKTLNIKDGDGNTALVVMAETYSDRASYFYGSLILKLLQAGAETHHKDFRGVTAREYIKEVYDYECIREGNANNNPGSDCNTNLYKEIISYFDKPQVKPKSNKKTTRKNKKGKKAKKTRRIKHTKSKTRKNKNQYKRMKKQRRGN